MKRSVLLPLVLIPCLFSFGFGQTRTVETRTSVDSTKGDTTITKSVVISKSEDITPRTGIIIINPLKFLLFYNVSYMARVSPGVAVGGGVQIPTPAGVDGWGINFEVRLHPSGKSPGGFYVAPNVAYNSIRAGGGEYNPVSVGVLVGWQWFPGDEFAIGLGIGVDRYSGSGSSDDGNITKFRGTVPALRFDIGYAW